MKCVGINDLQHVFTDDAPDTFDTVRNYPRVLKQA